MATLTVVDLGTTGSTDVVGAMSSAGGSGDKFLNNNRTAFLISNGNGSTCNVTATKQTTPPQLSGFGVVTKANYTLAVPTTKIGMTPFFENTFNDTSNLVNITYDVTTTVKVGAFNFPKLTTEQ